MFEVRREPTESILQLLDDITMGTNGAHYRHLDTRKKITELDAPLFYTLERNNKAIGNITVSERNEDWYLRHFAFSKGLQGSGQKKPNARGKSRLKREVSSFFQSLLNGSYTSKQGRCIYAYIDPENQKSLWVSESFGFKKVRSIATQSFSRFSPKQTKRLVKDLSWKEVESFIEREYGNHSFYHPVQTSKGPFYGLRNNNDDLIAITKITRAEWEIKRLPGLFGGTLVKVIPFIPLLNKLIQPKHHSFLVPDAVWVKDNDPKLVQELFEGVLHDTSLNLILWWVDKYESHYDALKGKINWGPVHKIIGVHDAYLMVLGNDQLIEDLKKEPHFTSGYDFV
jgi:hypothetical protein